ncbi:MAG: class I tRNA ligase family protein, partial [Paracoccus sp. (in: a-proteobacteria)]|nr:class I tRNA ligase family protein [Paracoccus sp. (in: a-proteobacteria)]
SAALLGPHFDIHGGGLDLQFPHHENEIAQSCCAHPGEGFANIWLHNEMLQVEGKKMSKSLGNFFTVRDLLDKGIPGEVIRFVMLSTHYRKPMDWTEAKAADAEKHLSNWYLALHKAGFNGTMVEILKRGNFWKPSPEVLEALANDLNTSGAIAALHSINKDGTAVQIASFAASLELLGLVPDWDKLDALAGSAAGSTGDHPYHDRIAAYLRDRQDAKKVKDFQRADLIRSVLERAGVAVTDMPGGIPSFEISSDFDPKVLDELNG